MSNENILVEVQQLVDQCSGLSVEDLKKQTSAEQTALYSQLKEVLERMSVRKVQLDTQLETSKKNLEELLVQIKKDYKVDTLDKLEAVRDSLLKDFQESCTELKLVLQAPVKEVEVA